MGDLVENTEKHENDPQICGDPVDDEHIRTGGSEVTRGCDEGNPP